MLWPRIQQRGCIGGVLAWISNSTDFQAPGRSPFGPQIIADLGFVLFCTGSAFPLGNFPAFCREPLARARQRFG
jgi:hypothetical protein